MFRRIVLGNLSGLVVILCLGTTPGNAVPSFGALSKSAGVETEHKVQDVPPSGEAQRRKGRHPPRVGGREIRPDVERRRRLHEQSQRAQQRRRAEDGQRRVDRQRRRAERERRRVERQRRRADRDRRRARRDHRRRRGSRGSVDVFIWPPFFGYDPYYYDPYYDPYYAPRRRYYRSRISCKRARNLVRRRGYHRLRAYDCRGKVYGFYARRGGKRYKVRVSAYTGRILSVRRY